LSGIEGSFCFDQLEAAAFLCCACTVEKIVKERTLEGV